MAAKRFKKKNESFGDKVKNFFINYRKYLSAGAVLVLLALVIATYSQETETKKPAVETEETNAEDNDQLGTQDFEVDAHKEINTLIKNYYKFYAKGDIDALEKIAYPISDTEKSYIKLFSKYVESYEDLTCYTKKGISDGEFVVSVKLGMKFDGIKTAAPGLDFFYIRTDKDGNCYIDNAYSQFNQSNQENTTESKINSLVNDFEQDEDVIALQKEVQESYNKALDSDADLKKMVDKTLQGAITDWVASFGKKAVDTQQKTDQKDTKTDQKDSDKEDQDKDSEKTDKKDKDKKESKDTKNNKKDTSKKDKAKKDTSKKDTSQKEVKTKTVYAKTGLNLRKKSNTDSKILKLIKKGAKITVYGDAKDGWYKVSYKNITGYVMKKYTVTDKSKIKKAKKTKSTKSSKADQVIFIPEGKRIELEQSVNVRAAMNVDSELVGVAYKGEVVTVVMSYDDGWTKVLWNDITGYIKSEYLQ